MCEIIRGLKEQTISGFKMEYHDPKYDKTVVLDYKAFLLGLRKIELEVAYIILNDNDSPKLFGYVWKINNIKFIDGSFHTHCGQIKLVIRNFIHFWTEIVNDAIRESDRMAHTINKSMLLAMIENSIRLHEEKQVYFEKEFLPVTSPEDKKAFKEIVEKYKLFMEKMNRIKQEADKHDNVGNAREFAIQHFEVSLLRKTALLEYTHTYISLTLSRHVYRIRVSMEECLLRVKNNLKKMEEDRDLILNNLMMELYDKNKERLTLNRKENRCSYEEADIEYTINKLKGKIEDYQKTTPIPRLENEMRYWENMIKEFDKIESVLKKLKREKVKIEELEKQCKPNKCEEQVHSKKECCEHTLEMIRKRKTLIKEKLTDAARALVTFFGVRGQNRIFYTDNIGKYFVDEYGHQIYFFEFGKRVCHLDCKGNYKQINEDDKYYYDRNGRYVVNDDGEKVYQIAPCTSTYNLCHDGLLMKTTVDCGHSDRISPNCHMQLKDPNDREIIPILEPMIIKETLSRDVVQYLWENVSHVLPESGRDLGQLRPNNPIHELAHSILFHRYRRTKEELTKLKHEAKIYQDEILRGRKEKVMARSVAWKSKQIHTSKTADTDDVYERMIHDAHVERAEFIRCLNFFED